MMANMVTGSEPLSNFGKYIDGLKSRKLDDVIAVKQNAYDRWVRVSEAPMFSEALWSC